MLYLWLKAFHIIAVIAWMAGLFYLPRLLVYHAEAAPGRPISETFKVMERGCSRQSWPRRNCDLGLGYWASPIGSPVSSSSPQPVVRGQAGGGRGIDRLSFLAVCGTDAPSPKTSGSSRRGTSA